MTDPTKIFANPPNLTIKIVDPTQSYQIAVLSVIGIIQVVKDLTYE